MTTAPEQLEQAGQWSLNEPLGGWGSFYELVLDGLSEGVVVQDLSGAIQVANPAALRIHGIFDRADQALYDAKHRGGGCWRIA